VSAAFHSRFVAEARERLATALEGVDFKAGRVPVFANTTAAEYPNEATAARQLLARQLAEPVAFVEEIHAMHAAGVRTFVEVGPGARLTGLVKAILEGVPHQAIALDASSGKRSNIVDLARMLAQLAALGHRVELTAWEPVPPASASPRKPG